MERTYWIGLLFALIVLLAVFFRMRNAGMKERYATWWVVIVVGTTIVSLFPGLSVDASRADEERRRLVEEISILNLRIEELEAESRSHRP